MSQLEENQYIMRRASSDGQPVQVTDLHEDLEMPGQSPSIRELQLWPK